MIHRSRLIQFGLLSGAVHLALLAAGLPLLTPVTPNVAPTNTALRAVLAPMPELTSRDSHVATPVQAGHTLSEPDQQQNAAPTRSRPTISVPPRARTARTTHALRERTTKRTYITPAEAPVTASNGAPIHPDRLLPPASSAPSTEQLAQWRAQVRIHLTQRLQSGFDYPLLARRRGWQGVVHLRFVVTPQGHVTGVELATSSGHRLLDDSALHNARGIQALPIVLNAGAPVAPLSVEIPVRFLLTG